MTEVSFHFNVPERAGYACRLLRKALRSNARVVVTAPVAELVSLDRLLWTFDPVEFVPHVRALRGESVASHLADTPVWLVDEVGSVPHHQVLVNLGREVPVGFESYERVIEIVSSADEDRAGARARWKHYASRGYPIVKHEVAAP